MNTISKKALAVIFILLIFLVGLATAWNMLQAGTDYKFMSGFAKVKSQIESEMTNEFVRKTDWVNANGLFHRLFQDTIVRDNDYTVHKLSNGQIMYDLPERDMTKYAGYVEELDTALKKEGIDFIYVQIPFKIKDDSFMPPGTHANGNENADQMVQLLREKGINTLDLRDNIREEGLDWSSLFFKTDHHWTPQTAFWAADHIMERIHDDYGYEINESYYDTDNYELKTYENWMLGSVGRRTGVWYDGLDDFTLFNPKFPTEFSFEAKNKKGTETRGGDFWNTMYLWDNLRQRADFERNTYSTYFGKDYSKAHVTNHRCGNGLRILMIRESFSCALTPFIALNADEVVTIDLRRYHKKSVPELCKEHDINVVMLDYNPSAFSKKQFDFFDRDM